jgi:hypothetical protein
MKKIVIVGVVLAASWAASACSHELTPVEHAVDVARMQCTDPRVSRDEARIVRETTVIAVEPITFVSWSTRQTGGRALGGTKLVVNAPDGVGALELARVLQCHTAKALLGKVDPAALAADPFYLADDWIDSQVTSEEGLLVVKLRADGIGRNLIVLRRATAFANAHRPVASVY